MALFASVCFGVPIATPQTTELAWGLGAGKQDASRQSGALFREISSHLAGGRGGQETARPAKPRIEPFPAQLDPASFPPSPAGRTRAPSVTAIGADPTAFIENKGQVNEAARFYLRSRGQTVWITEAGILFDAVRVISGSDQTVSDKKARSPHETLETLKRSLPRERLTFAQEFVGGSKRMRIEAKNVQPGTYNYFVGNTLATWRTSVRAYAEIDYRNVWDGVDVKLYARGTSLEQEFIVRPGADISQIHVAYRGIEGLRVDEDGSLRIQTAFGEVRESAPNIYQEIDGKRVGVAGRFKILGDTVYTFEVHGYQPQYALVIDPTLIYSTFLGGSGDEAGSLAGSFNVAVDAAGNAYVSGATASLNFPTTIGAFQTHEVSLSAFVTKLNSNGTALVYSTFLGGNSNSLGFGVTVDGAGDAYIVGYTAASDFPTTPGAFQASFRGGGLDVFVTKLNSTGTELVYSTYLGGSRQDIGFGIAVDSSGFAYVTGGSDSIDFPTTSGAFQPAFPRCIFEVAQQCPGKGSSVFVTKLNPSGTGLVYSTFVQGGRAEGGSGIAVDSAGNAYVTGFTTSPDFPTTANAVQPSCQPGSNVSRTFPDGFALKLNPLGTGLVYSTCFGRPSDGGGQGIAIDAAGNAYFVGPGGLPPTPGAFGTSGGAFLTKLDALGALLYSGHFGGSGAFASGVAVDASGNAYFTGATLSGSYDAFVAKVNPSGNQLIYAISLAGSRDDIATGIAVDGSHNAYVVGSTGSPDFPTTPVAAQPGYGGGDSDAFVVKIADAAPTQFSLTAIRPNKGGDIGSVTVTVGGTGFKTGATVLLSRTGQADIIGGPVGVSADGDSATTTFGLTGAPRGPSDVVVIQPDGTSASLSKAFTIEEGRAARIWVDIVGRNTIRAPAPEVGGSGQGTVYLLFGNTGNVDSDPVTVSLSVPPTVGSTIVSAPGVTTSGISEDGEESVVAIDSVVPPGNVPQIGVVALRPPAGRYRLTASAHSSTIPPDVVFREFMGELQLTNENVSVPFNPCYGVIRPGCVDLWGVQPAIIKLFTQFENEIFFLNGGPIPLKITGGNEPDKHNPFSNCAHFLGFAIDIRFDQRILDVLLANPDIFGTGAATRDQKEKGIVNIWHWNGLRILLEDNPLHFHLRPDDDTVCTDTTFDLTVVQSEDPNSKSGPLGVGPAGYISGAEPLRYSIDFENLPTATAPAQDVVISDQLNPALLDLRSITLGPIVIGSNVISFPAGDTEFLRRVDLRPTRQLILQIETHLDTASSTLSWHFSSIDPATNGPVTDPTAGFLPPNVHSPEGQGTVFFTAMSRNDLATDTTIANQASVVFDGNRPITTPVWVNTLDNTLPLSHVVTLPAIEGSPTFRVEWSGTDRGSGVRDYTVYVARDSEGFNAFVSATTDTAALFHGEPGHTYAFFSIARDQAGNVESKLPVGETTTRVVADTIPPTTIAAVTPPPNTNGWNNSSVTVTLASVDNPGGSSVREITYSRTGAEVGETTVTGGSTSAMVSAEGVTSFSYFATDNAGNRESRKTLAIQIDKTSPTVTFGSPSPAPNSAGWNNTDVSVPFTANDNLSGVATTSIASPLALTTEGAAVTGTVTATDKAGNSASFGSPPVKIDKTPPTVACVLVPPRKRGNDEGHGRLFFQVTASDTLSGVTSITLGDIQLTDGEIIRIQRTERPGVRLVLKTEDDDQDDPRIRRFRVGPGADVIKATDGAGNVGTAGCLLPPRRDNDDSGKWGDRGKGRERARSDS